MINKKHVNFLLKLRYNSVRSGKLNDFMLFGFFFLFFRWMTATIALFLVIPSRHFCSSFVKKKRGKTKKQKNVNVRKDKEKVTKDWRERAENWRFPSAVTFILVEGLNQLLSARLDAEAHIWTLSCRYEVSLENTAGQAATNQHADWVNTLRLLWEQKCDGPSEDRMMWWR